MDSYANLINSRSPQSKNSPDHPIGHRYLNTPKNHAPYHFNPPQNRISPPYFVPLSGTTSCQPADCVTASGSCCDGIPVDGIVGGADSVDVTVCFKLTSPLEPSKWEAKKRRFCCATAEVPVLCPRGAKHSARR